MTGVNKSLDADYGALYVTYPYTVMLTRDNDVITVLHLPSGTHRHYSLGAEDKDDVPSSVRPDRPMDHGMTGEASSTPLTPCRLFGGSGVSWYD